ncbi:MAG: flagellar motor switch protein FliM [Firmicutes bacterium]|nr:flagellar motor switch protein FliM [Bacillota bacterium]
MGKDVLSQTEIDSLISALSSGKLEDEEEDEDSSEFRSYDFRRPSKFSKEQMRTLQVLHENYARILGNFLSAYLRIPVQIQLVSASQVTYEEFIFSLPVPTLVTVFSMNPEMGNAMLETSPSVVFPLIDIVFGGEGHSPAHTRELTDIEITVMRRINGKLLNNLRYVWEDIVSLAPEVENMDTNPQFNQMFASTETVALLTFSVQIKESQGLINLCFPFITLEKIMPRLTSQFWFRQPHQEASEFQEEHLLKQLNEVDVNLSVVLGRTTITLAEFLQFQEGDIIQLFRQEGDDLDVYIENEHLLKGQPGVLGQNLALQVTGWVEKEEEKNA